MDDILTIVIRERTNPIVRFVNGPSRPSCTEFICPVILSHREFRGPLETMGIHRYTKYYKFWFVGEFLPPRDKYYNYTYQNVSGEVSRSDQFSENVQIIFNQKGWKADLAMNQEVSEAEYDAEVWKWASEGLRAKIKIKAEMEKICTDYTDFFRRGIEDWRDI